MAESDKTIILPDSQSGMVPAWYAYGNNGNWNNGFFGNGFGSSFFGGLLGAIVPGLFNGGFGNWGGNGNGAAAASLGAQATANANAEMILNAINGTDSDVRLLATTLNGDVDALRLGINTVQGAIATVGAQLGMTGLQVINEVQRGNADIASRICECCCSAKQLIAEQGFQNQIATINQTTQLSGAIADLKATVIDQFCQAEKRDMQDKINSLTANNTLLRSQIDNAAQTAQIASLIAPIAKEVDDIKCKLPSTATVQYPNLVAISTTPNFNNGFGWNNGFWGNGFFGGNGSYWG